jgi:hypothetical protein
VVAKITIGPKIMMGQKNRTPKNFPVKRVLGSLPYKAIKSHQSLRNILRGRKIAAVVQKTLRRKDIQMSLRAIVSPVAVFLGGSVRAGRGLGSAKDQGRRLLAKFLASILSAGWTLVMVIRLRV